MNKKIYLASKSPRRKQILEDLGLECEVVASDFEEHNYLAIEPLELAKAHAIGKATAALKNIRKGGSGIVLGADTFVLLDRQVLGKPVDRDDAARILAQLSGRTQTVITAISLIDIDSKYQLARTEQSTVTFIELDEKMINHYLDFGEYVDKAGAYAIQGHGMVLVKDIRGSFTNIVGLPSHLLLEMLKQI